MNRMLLTRRESLWGFLRVVVVEGEQRGLDMCLYWQPSRLLKDFLTFVKWKCKGLTFKVEKRGWGVFSRVLRSREHMVVSLWSN